MLDAHHGFLSSCVEVWSSNMITGPRMRHQRDAGMLRRWCHGNHGTMGALWLQSHTPPLKRGLLDCNHEKKHIPINGSIATMGYLMILLEQKISSVLLFLRSSPWHTCTSPWQPWWRCLQPCDKMISDTDTFNQFSCGIFLITHGTFTVTRFVRLSYPSWIRAMWKGLTTKCSLNSTL